MATDSQPIVLVIDDTDDSAFQSVLTSVGLTVHHLHPADVDSSDLASVDVVVVDYRLDEWPERDGAPFTLRPRDGLALAALLQRQVHDAEQTSPTAFVIRTGHMEELASPLPAESRPHVLAQLNNLEWVFEKGADATAAVAQIRSLANAIRALPRTWPGENTDETLRTACRLLAIDPVQDPEAESDFLSCLPPLYSMSRWSHGLAFIRWLLHRTLPYPSFLMSQIELAARLRLSSVGITRLLAESNNPFVTCEYRGILSEFVGRRWWRSPVERCIWHGTEGNSLDGLAIRNWLEQATGISVESSSAGDYPVVCLDVQHRPLPETFPMDECVRIRPDNWPAFADQAWTTIALAREHQGLASLVITEDRHKLLTNESRI